jgi:hypothetical protein
LSLRWDFVGFALSVATFFNEVKNNTPLLYKSEFGALCRDIIIVA